MTYKEELQTTIEYAKLFTTFEYEKISLTSVNTNTSYSVHFRDDMYYLTAMSAFPNIMDLVYNYRHLDDDSWFWSYDGEKISFKDLIKKLEHDI